MAANQKFETPKISTKVTKPRKIEQEANNAFTLSSDDEEPSPVLARNPVVQESELDIRPKRCKGKAILGENQFSVFISRTVIGSPNLISELVSRAKIC